MDPRHFDFVPCQFGLRAVVGLSDERQDMNLDIVLLSVAKLVEMAANLFFFHFYVIKVFLEPVHEAILGLAYILDFAFGACEAIYQVL